MFGYSISCLKTEIETRFDEAVVISNDKNTEVNKKVYLAKSRFYINEIRYAIFLLKGFENILDFSYEDGFFETTKILSEILSTLRRNLVQIEEGLQSPASEEVTRNQIKDIERAIYFLRHMATSWER